MGATPTTTPRPFTKLASPDKQQNGGKREWDEFAGHVPAVIEHDVRRHSADHDSDDEYRAKCRRTPRQEQYDRRQFRDADGDPEPGGISPMPEGDRPTARV